MRSTLDLTTIAGVNPFLAVGAAGTGNLYASNNALIKTEGVTVALNPGSVGTATINNSQWNALGMAVGGSGQGALNLLNNSILTSTDSVIGNSTGAVGDAVVSASTWTISGPLAIGRDGGVGHLSITNGGSVTLTPNASALILGFNGGDGTIVVSGPNSTLNVNNAGSFIALGDDEKGAMTVENQGVVRTRVLLLGDETGENFTVAAEAKTGGVISIGNTIIMNLGSTLRATSGGAVTVGTVAAVANAIRIDEGAKNSGRRSNRRQPDQ